MRTKRRLRSVAIVLPSLVLSGLVCAPIAGQTPAPAPQPRKIVTATTASPVVLQNKPPAPQVVTILHRLNGIKVFRLLVRNQEQVEAIVRLDQAFNLAGEVHTNVIAGLALDDGQTIAAWLPEAEAELPPPVPFAVPRTPRAPRAPGTTAPLDGQTPATNVAPLPPLPRMSAVEARAIAESKLAESKFEKDFLDSADLRIITRDGKRISGRYIGLDGLTGLSLITLTNGSVPLDVDLKEEKVTVGQHLRVIGPQPAPGTESGARSPMYIRIGETEGLIVSVTRSPSGGITKIKVKSAKFTPANIGGVAISDNNETLGIVDAVEGTAATIVPLNLVRLAARRVTARQASVPRPWLGIRGEPISEGSLDRILRSGWATERARALTEKRQGILLTQVAPGSPAALAKLKPGDVILTVNNGFVRNAEDFSSLLDEVDPASSVLFTVARPDKESSEPIEIKLGESPDGFFPRRFMTPQFPRFMKPNTLLGEGIEAIALKPQVASRFGSGGGLLVVSVQPETDAFEAGLRAGDVVETIDGQPVYSAAGFVVLPRTRGAKSNCVVVRNRERITLKFKYSTHEDESKEP